ncbi:MAG: DUF115 domain-containing protein [Spirochaetaceae bacterium]|jgi:hypothetical protein|nr:DUF115 domain-containing protein [Spirochaetaceae bacterium]
MKVNAFALILLPLRLTGMEKNDIYKKNMEAARRFVPGIEQKVGGAGVEADLVLEKAASGAPTARLEGRYLHSARDPEREAARLVFAADRAEPGENRAVLLLGFGLGYAAEAAAALAPPPLIIAVEKRSGILRAAFETRDLTGILDKRIVFVLGDEPDAITAALKISPKKLSVIRNPALTAADTAFYREVERHIENWRTKDAVNEATLRRFGKRWTRNQAANLWAVRDLPGIDLLAGRFDFPVLLLAAGPSLDELGGRIADLAGRCIVVAVDTALRFLKREGVKPDFAVSVDPQYWNTRHLDRCLPEESVLITEAAVYPTVLRNRPGRRSAAGKDFLYASSYPLSGFVEARVDVKGRLGAGGSVASTAWDFASSLAPAHRPIFIGGLDLAFPGLATHYRGALFEEHALAGAKRFLPAETRSLCALLDAAPFFAKAADGSTVLTDKRLALYASWFENRLKSSKNRDSLRLSGRGLAINGMKTTGIEEVLALPPCRTAISERLEQVSNEISQKWNSKPERKARRDRYEAACTALTGGLKAALDTARSVLTDMAVLEHSRAREAVLKRMDAAKAALLNSEVRSIAGFSHFDSKGPLQTEGAEGAGQLTEEACKELIDCIGFTLSALKRPYP